LYQSIVINWLGWASSSRLVRFPSTEKLLKDEVIELVYKFLDSEEKKKLYLYMNMDQLIVC
jgi:hypothetical protein